MRATVLGRVALAGGLALLTLPATAGAAFPGGHGRLAYFQGDVGSTLPYGLHVYGNPGVVGPFCQEGVSGTCGRNPAWSRDSRLAYDLGDGRLMTSSASGFGRRSFTFSGIAAKRPAWSPDNSQLVFEGVAGGRSQLYIVNANGTSLRRLTGAGGGQPSWSLNNRIAFRRARNLWVVNPDGSGLRRLTSRGASTPDWSPHASQITFTRGGNLYRLRSNGTRLRRLSRKRGIAEPAWQTSGQRIYYQRSDGGNSLIYSLRIDGTRQELETGGEEGRRRFVAQPAQEPL